MHWMFRTGVFRDRVLSADEAMSVAREVDATYAIAYVNVDEAKSPDKTLAGLVEHGTLVTRFENADPPLSTLAGRGIERQWRALEVVLRSERLGPPIEIYRLK
jgi:hypothetical protein